MTKKNNIPKIDKYNDTGEYLRIINQKYIEIDYKAEGSIDSELNKNISQIEIKKRAFINKLDTSVAYVNYFIEYFDYDSNLLTIYCALMFAIMTEDSDLPMDHFIDLISSAFDDDDMVDKIVGLVDHNTDPTMVKKKRGSSHSDSLQIDMDHLKCILCIGMVYKMLIPIISQYYRMRTNEIPKNIDEKSFYFICFTSIIPIFDDYYGVSVYNKFYQTATSRVSKIAGKNRIIWDILENEGTTPLTHINDITRNLFVDITQKTIFSKSAINFIHVCFDRANRNKLRTKTDYNYVPMEMNFGGDEDEMTPLDLLAINNANISSKDKASANAVIKDFIRNKCEEYDITITDEMRQYYIKNYKPVDAQMVLIIMYLSIHTSHGYQDYIKMEQIIDIMIIMKHYFECTGCKYIQYIISGDFTNSTPKRVNKNTIDAYFEDYGIDDIYSDAMGHIPVDKQREYVKILISPFVVLDYDLYSEGELDEKTKIQDINDKVAIDEILRFIMIFDE